MKNIIFILFTSSIFLFCTNKGKKENIDEVSNLVTDTKSEIENYSDTHDVTQTPNFKENLLKNIQQFIISKNVLESQRPNIIINSVSLNDDYSVMELSYDLKHSETWWNESNETVLKELKDHSKYNINIDIIEAHEQEAKVQLDITKFYTANNINYYGQNYADSEKIKFTEVATFNFLSDENRFKDNKISSIFNAIRGRKVKREELLGLNLNELGYLRNEFYARKGYQFKTEKMKNYFSEQNWYTPTTTNITGLLNELELENVFYIKAMETELLMDSSTDIKTTLSAIYQIGQTKKLTKADLQKLTPHQLSYLRNEFYARKGLVFRSERLAKYFSNLDWYEEKADNVDNLLTSLEKENIQFIKSVERSKQ